MQILLNCSDDVKVETALRNTMLRIASEALSNSIFHSGIIENPDTHVKIDVKATRKKITIKVADNGVGARVLNHGIGIDRMNQLSRQVNSWGDIVSNLEIRSKVQKGTTVVFSATYKS